MSPRPHGQLERAHKALPAAFHPPSKTPELLAFLQSSVKLHRPLEEASPRRQIMWRESLEHEEQIKSEGAADLATKTAESSAAQLPVLIPTKFSRTNSANSGISLNRSSIEGETVTAAADLLAKFVVPAGPPAEPISKPKPLRLLANKTRPVNVKAEDSAGKTKAPRSRVASTVRRVSLSVKDAHPFSLLIDSAAGTTRMESPGALRRRECSRSSPGCQSSHRLGRPQIAHPGQAIAESRIGPQQGEHWVS